MDDREIIKLYNCRSGCIARNREEIWETCIIYNWQADKESVRC